MPADLVPPLTAGAIHAAIDHGERIAEAVAQQIRKPSFDAVAELEARNPDFRTGAWLPAAFEYAAGDPLMDAMIGRPWVAALVRKLVVYRRAVPSPGDWPLRRGAAVWTRGR